MTVHVGQVTSEVHATESDAGDAGPGGEVNEWEEGARLVTRMARIDRDRRRTATGYGDD